MEAKGQMSSAMTLTVFVLFYFETQSLTEHHWFHYDGQPLSNRNPPVFASPSTAGVTNVHHRAWLLGIVRIMGIQTGGLISV